MTTPRRRLLLFTALVIAAWGGVIVSHWTPSIRLQNDCVILMDQIDDAEVVAVVTQLLAKVCGVPVRVTPNHLQFPDDAYNAQRQQWDYRVFDLHIELLLPFKEHHTWRPRGIASSVTAFGQRTVCGTDFQSPMTQHSAAVGNTNERCARFTRSPHSH